MNAITLHIQLLKNGEIILQFVHKKFSFDENDVRKTAREFILKWYEGLAIGEVTTHALFKAKKTSHKTRSLWQPAHTNPGYSDGEISSTDSSHLHTHTHTNTHTHKKGGMWPKEGMAGNTNLGCIVPSGLMLAHLRERLYVLSLCTTSRSLVPCMKEKERKQTMPLIRLSNEKQGVQLCF